MNYRIRRARSAASVLRLLAARLYMIEMEPMMRIAPYTLLGYRVFKSRPLRHTEICPTLIPR